MKKKLLSLILVAAMGVSMLVGCGGTAGTDGTEVGNAGYDREAIENLIASSEGKTIKLQVWCSETAAYQTVMSEVLESFKKEYPTVTFDIVLGAQSESSCKDRVLEDPEAAADVFVFADDQLNDLVQAGALQEVVKTYTYDPAQTNNEATVNAAKVNDKLYAYPLTASNGYFLYYNSKYISAEDAQTFEGILAAAEKSGKKFGIDMGNAWYLFSFFAGAGCNLSLNADGSNSCDWNNATGLAVANAIKELCSSSAFVSIGDADAQASVAAKDELVAYVDGVWASETFAAAYGDGYSATKLPTFKVDGKDVQMASYAGYKMVGVNSYSKEKGWAMLLAEYITNQASQTKIGVAVAEAPANLEAAKASELASNIALKGLAEQAPYSYRQVVGDAFWTPAGSLGAGLVDGSHTDIQKALDDAVLGITQPVASN